MKTIIFSIALVLGFMIGPVSAQKTTVHIPRDNNNQTLVKGNAHIGAIRPQKVNDVVVSIKNPAWDYVPRRVHVGFMPVHVKTKTVVGNNPSWNNSTLAIPEKF